MNIVIKNKDTLLSKRIINITWRELKETKMLTYVNDDIEGMR